MPKRFLQVLFVVFFLSFSVSILASEIKELQRNSVVLPSYSKYGYIDRVLCIDGLKVLQTIAFDKDKGTGAAVSNIQLYEDKKGNVVPVRCQ